MATGGSSRQRMDDASWGQEVGLIAMLDEGTTPIDAQGDKLQESLVIIVEDSGAADALIDLADRVLEGVLHDDVLSQVPVIGTLVAAYRIGLGIREHLFVRKIVRFLVQLREIPEHERSRLRTRLENDAMLRRKVGELLMCLLDRFDEIEKAELFARAFKAYVQERIDFVTLQRMGVAIDRCLVADIRLLPSVNPWYELPTPTASSLYLAGLTELASVLPVVGIGEERTRPGALNKFQLSDFGKLFVEVVLGEQRP